MAWSQNDFWPIWEAAGSTFPHSFHHSLLSVQIRWRPKWPPREGSGFAAQQQTRIWVDLSSDFNQAVIVGSPSRKGFLLSPYPFSSTWTVNHFPWCLKPFSILVFMLLEIWKPQPSEIYESRDHVSFAHQDPYPLAPCLAYSIYKLRKYCWRANGWMNGWVDANCKH